MSIFKDEEETKRVIFNIRMDLAERLESAKDGARRLGRKLDSDGAVNEALEKFLKKAEKKLAEMLAKHEGRRPEPGASFNGDDEGDAADTTAETPDANPTKAAPPASPANPE